MMEPRYAKKESYLPKQPPYYKRMEATCKFREFIYKLFSFVVVLVATGPCTRALN